MENNLENTTNNNKINIEYSQFDSERMRLNAGPQHPSTHGVLRLEVELDGEIVTDIIPHLGYLHRCFEKHCENSNYNQIVPFVDRLDYVSAINNEFPYVMAVEKLAGIEVSEKVQILRAMCAEINRIANHLLAISAFGLDSGAFTPLLFLFREREFALGILEKLSGARLLYNYFCPGGVRYEIYSDFKKDVKVFIDSVRLAMKEMEDLLIFNDIFIKRTEKIGLLPKEVAINFACSGPVARGSGINFDIRKSAPYSSYDKFDFDIPVVEPGKEVVGVSGDCWSRNWVRVKEIEESCKILEQGITLLPDEGSVTDGIPKKLKVPAGEVYCKAENTKGELGFYLVSNGSDKPERVRARATSFVNLAILPSISKGYMFADLIMILGSIDIVLGEVDR